MPKSTTSISKLSTIYLIFASSSSPSSYAFAPRPHYFSKSYTSESTTTNILLMSSKPKSGDVVTIDYTITPNEDFVPTPLFDSGKDISFVLGEGNYLPGLHESVSSMDIGQSQTGILLDAGYGSRRDELVATVPKGAQDGLDYDSIKVGTELYLANGLKCKVTSVTDSDFTIDANPPLAGATYTADVTLKSKADGPCKEKFDYIPQGVSNDSSPYMVMTIALGCFWGGELAYMRVNGVVGTAVGYTQGSVDNPSYKQVCSGTTGHTEGIQVIYNPNIVSYRELVEIGMERLGESKFLLNQVGNDRGTQYRHGIYYHNDEQKKIAEEVIKSFGDRCKTESKPAMVFYKAEDYHQQYLLKGGQSARKNAKEVIRCYG